MTMSQDVVTRFGKEVTYIEIAHQGDAAQALRTAQRLVGNHIAYCTAKMAELAKQPAQLVLFER
jgi:hypothetical protein